MQIRIAGTANDSIVDGPGIRYTVFTQGCPHKCEGCHNPQTHDFNGGSIMDTEVILSEILSNPLLDGVTFSGGEPFCQAEALNCIAEKISGTTLNIVTYTGYTFEQLLLMSEKNTNIRRLLQFTDILIDGKFEISQKSMDCSFRGSKNQRIIDCKKSLETSVLTEYII